MEASHHIPAPSRRRFAEIVRRHQAGVCAAAYGVTGDRALSEDIAQDTFLVAWRTLPSLRDPSKLGEWLRGIARNLARKARRRRAVAALDDCGELAAADDPAGDAVAQDEAHLAWAALRELPARYREALVLYYWEEQSARRVAASLGITEATAMQRLSRGRALLRDEILRRVEGTLRRARPGAALTAAILAAVAAATAKAAAAATASAATASAGTGAVTGSPGTASAATGAVTGSPGTGNAATGNAVTGNAATGNAATASPATASPATASPATASSATASSATASSATASSATASSATASSATGNAATSNAATGNAATSNAATGNAATSNAATGNAATGNAATGNAATGNAVTGNAVTGNAVTGNAVTSNAATSNAATSNAATGNAVTGNAATGNAVTGSSATSSAATVGARSLAARVSRRVIWKAGLTLVGLGALAPIAAWSERRRASGAGRPARDASESAPSSGDASSTALRRDAQGRSSATAPASSGPPGPPDAPDPAFADDDLASYGDPTSPTITSSDLPTNALGLLSAALSLCFVDELVDRPCRIEVEVRGGKIAATRVEPFDGASRRVVARTLQDMPVALDPAALIAWLAADKLITAVRDDTRLADHDQAMAVGDFVGLCAKARLEGLAIAGADGTRHLRFGWVRDVSPPVDRQAYVDLGVAAGPSCGPASAPVTVVSFLDLAGAWGFAGKSLAAWREVLARYPRDVRLVVKLCPLGPEHELVAEAVHAAGAQGAWWPMLERVAASPEHQTLDDLERHAASLGLDAAQLRDDLTRRTFRDALELDRDQMAAMAIDGVPGALVNGRRVHGAVPAATCADAVEDSLRSLARRTGTASPG